MSQPVEQHQRAAGAIQSAAERAATASASAARLLRLGAEFCVLFAGIPLLLYFDVVPLPMAMGLLIVLALGVLLWLLLDSTFDNRQLWCPGHLRARMRGMLAVFAIGGAGIIAYTALVEPDLLLRLPRENTRLWLVIMVFYPLVSVYPQEIIYRAFLFHRYGPLFRRRWAMILASAAAFGYMHMIFENFLAVALTFIGGLVFARTYDRTRSTLVVSVEHALFGDLIFTIGLGWYFYTGSVGA